MDAPLAPTTNPTHPNRSSNLPQPPVPDAQPLTRRDGLACLLFLPYHHSHPVLPQLQLDLLECAWPDQVLGRQDGKLVTNERGEVMLAGLRVHMGVSYGIPEVCWDVQVGRVGCEGEGEFWRGGTQGTKATTQGARGWLQGTKGTAQGARATTQGTRGATQGTRGTSQGAGGTTQGTGIGRPLVHRLVRADGARMVGGSIHGYGQVLDVVWVRVTELGSFRSQSVNTIG